MSDIYEDWEGPLEIIGGNKEMSQQELYDTLCKKCYIKNCKPSKKEIKGIILTDYKERCECCGKVDYIVDYIEE